MPAFIVIIPVYNSEIYLLDCVTSVLNQSYQNFQIVLVDDGSLDGSGKMCDDFQRVDNRIHAIHQSNGGQLSARLAGLRFVVENINVDDSYIVHLDSDDQIDIKALEILKDTIASNRCDVVFFTMKGRKNGNIVEDIGWTNIYEGLVTDKGKLLSIVLNDNKYNSLCCKAISTTLIPNDILKAFSDLHGIRHGEDLIQSLEFLKSSKRVMFIKDKLYIYTFNPTSVTRSVEPLSSIIDSRVQKYVWDFINKQRVWKDEDFSRYLAYCRHLLSNRIIRILSYYDKEDSLQALKAIQSDDYYKMVVSTSEKGDIILKMLSHNKLDEMVKIIKYRSALAKIFRMIYKAVINK